MRKLALALLSKIDQHFRQTKFYRTGAVEGWSQYRDQAATQALEDRVATESFLDSKQSSADRVDGLAEYFIAGFFRHADPSGNRVNYPGYGSANGFSINGLEGFARTAPLLAAWFSSGRGHEFAVGRERVSMVDLLAQAVRAGTDRRHPQYWGDVARNDQRILEAADVVRTLWLTRHVIWEQFDTRAKAAVNEWLGQAASASISHRNNWLLCQSVIKAFLKWNGYSRDEQFQEYREFKESYLGRGWFKDGPKGEVDFYNCWGIGYDIFWLGLIEPDLDASFIKEVLTGSTKFTSFLISPQGIPIMGRSLCYRTAVPCPLLIGHHVNPDIVPAGLARRALDVTWTHFIRRGCLSDGGLTMGYFGCDPRIIEHYSGPGSCHWGLRSIVLALMFRRDDPFWACSEERLPVEEADFVLSCEELGWKVTGSKETQEIVIEIIDNPDRYPTLQSYSPWNRIIECWLHRPLRPKNHEAKYLRKTYRSSDFLGES